jgi:general L-amino acid transport system substrate-binding protein
MKNVLNLGGALTLAASAFMLSTPVSAQQSPTIAKIKARGSLVCPVPTSPYLGFFEVAADGAWHGFDIDMCKAIASALLGAEAKTTFSAVSWADRFPALQAGTLDAVVMFTSWTRSRDSKLGLQFSAPYFFAGVRLLTQAPKVKAAKDLSGATICAAAGSTADKELVKYFAARNIKYKMLTFEKFSDASSAYKNKRCDALSGAGPGLAVLLASGELQGGVHTLLPDAVTMEPISAVVRQGDDAFLDVINWTFAALFEAERLGITKENVSAMKNDPNSSAEIKFLLGASPGVGNGMGLTDSWAFDVIKAVGNYREVYDRNLGQASPYKLPVGLNTLWNQGGLLYAPGFD